VRSVKPGEEPPSKLNEEEKEPGVLITRNEKSSPRTGIKAPFPKSKRKPRAVGQQEIWLGDRKRYCTTEKLTWGGGFPHSYRHEISSHEVEKRG